MQEKNNRALVVLSRTIQTYLVFELKMKPMFRRFKFFYEKLVDVSEQ